MLNLSKRFIGDNTSTYEELTTLLTQIEAVLNSRPLYTTGEDFEDNSILTPGLEQDLTNLLDNENNLKQWIQKQTSVIDSSLNIMKANQKW